MARRMIDYAVDGGNDLKVANGDFVRAESTVQHQKQLLICNKGEYKESPTLGVGVFDFIDDDERRELLSAIATEFGRDGMDVVNVAFGTGDNISVDAFYK